MISADIIGRGLERYLWNKVQEDYYFNGGEPPPIWLPTALAKHFKLSGKIRRKDLRNFLQGFDQHGKKLRAERRQSRRKTQASHGNVLCLQCRQELEHRAGRWPTRNCAPQWRPHFNEP